MKRRPILLKRVYEAPARQDGLRVLVDGLWPRGLTPQKASADLWLREVAPSARLRRWYRHDPRRRGRVTLLFAARSREQNNAVVLRDFLEGRKR